MVARGGGPQTCDPAEVDEKIHAACDVHDRSSKMVEFMKMEDGRTCPICSAHYSTSEEFCPVCMLRGALGEEAQSSEPSSIEAMAESILSGPRLRFENYEVLTHQDGSPIELGRGAMGITYKAIDVNLRRLATLKIIAEKYLGDESARLRFVREARSAASVRHLNVASVFHLGSEIVLVVLPPGITVKQHGPLVGLATESTVDAVVADIEVLDFEYQPI